MVEVRINGKAVDRMFQNMGQALAFAANNGECVNAETLGFAYAKAKAKAETKAEAKGGGGKEGGNGAAVSQA